MHEAEFDCARLLKDSPQTTRVALPKKSKSMTISAELPTNPSTVHMRRPSGILKTFSYPAFHTHTEYEEVRPISAHSAITPSTPTLPPISVSPNRSPPQKRRPPASHSSYGVETTLGPPPSYTTQQRTLSQDRLRPEQSRPKAGVVAERVTSPLNEVASTTKQQPSDVPTNDLLTALPTPQITDPDFSSPETLDSHSLDTPQQGSDTTPPSSVRETKMTEAPKTVTKGLGLGGVRDQGKASSSDETQKSEDLFLSIARTDASRMSALRTEKQRSRISLPFVSGVRPQTAGARSSPVSAQFDSHLTHSSERLLTKRSSLGQHAPGGRTSPISAYFDDTRSHVAKLSDQKSTVGSIGGRSYLQSRRHSNANDDTPRPPTRSGRSRMVSEILHADRFRDGDRVATESTISTTAPSTVWSELDELKSRIKRLELTGKLPPSSAAAMTTSERPRTATTAATTLSNSPKNNKTSVAALPSPIEGIPPTIHPLLHEALGNAKPGISQDVYQKLQATAQDALQMSSMLSQEGYGSNGAALSPQTERQIRRRTESMCRSLTELAIAMLTDSTNLNSPPLTPATRGQHAGTATALQNRTTSNDMHGNVPSATTRVQSRLESRLDSRRTSAVADQIHNANPSTEASPITTFRSPLTRIDSDSVPASRAPRPSTIVRSRRTRNHSYLDGATDTEDEPPPSVTARPASRAMTEIGSTYRSIARDRANFSREYTKQHPLPEPSAPVGMASAPSRAALPSHISINSRVTSRLTHRRPATDVVPPSQFDGSSPVTTPSHTARPPFTISVERRNPHVADPAANSPVATTSESAPGSGSDRRTSGTRRSLGFASRISSVSNKLKAARAERQASSSHASPNMAAVKSPLSRKASEQGDGQDVENAMPNDGLPESITVQRGS